MKHLKIIAEACNKSNKDQNDFSDGLDQGYRRLRALAWRSNLSHKWGLSKVQKNVKFDEIFHYFKKLAVWIIWFSTWYDDLMLWESVFWLEQATCKVLGSSET